MSTAIFGGKWKMIFRPMRRQQIPLESTNGASLKMNENPKPRSVNRITCSKVGDSSFLQSHSHRTSLPFTLTSLDVAPFVQ